MASRRSTSATAAAALTAAATAPGRGRPAGGGGASAAAAQQQQQQQQQQPPPSASSTGGGAPAAVVGGSWASSVSAGVAHSNSTNNSNGGGVSSRANGTTASNGSSGKGGAAGGGGGGGGVGDVEGSTGIVIKMRGLPYSATEGEIASFFAGIKLVRGGVSIGRDASGRASGEALVELASEQDASSAMLLHRKKIGNRYIELFRTRSGATTARGKNGRRGVDRRQRQRGERRAAAARMPFNSTEDVLAFFDGFGLASRRQDGAAGRQAPSGSTRSTTRGAPSSTSTTRTWGAGTLSSLCDGVTRRRPRAVLRAARADRRRAWRGRGSRGSLRRVGRAFGGRGYLHKSPRRGLARGGVPPPTHWGGASAVAAQLGWWRRGLLLARSMAFSIGQGAC